jgi:alkylated DNA repair dioxygenase AlkB
MHTRSRLPPIPEFEPIPLPDADVSLLRGIEMPATYGDILETLTAETKWRQEAVKIFGKPYQQPRLVAWYGDPGAAYSYSGLNLTPLPWTDLLRDIRHRVQDCTNARFNSVLLNLYRNQSDSMGLHSDDERELGPEPTIASLSFGSTRTFVLTHKADPSIQPVRLPLEAGEVLLMKGPTQRFWKHGVMKQTKPCGPRINLTFRMIHR